PSGDIFVGDINNHVIRKITPAAVVTTFAGSGINGFNPVGIASDQAGNLLVADAVNDVIRKITPAAVVSTFAGTVSNQGSANGTLAGATFNNPSDLKFDRAGNLFIAD